MNKVKKIVSVFLCLCLISSVFCSCSNNKNEEETKNDEVTQEESFSLEITYDSSFSPNESVLRAYKTLCNAVINGKTEVQFASEMQEEVFQLYYSGFPLRVLVDSIDTKEDKTGYVIKYKNSVDEHKALVGEFTEKIGQILDLCGKGSVSDEIFAANAYKYAATHISPSSDEASTVYDAVMYGEGMSAAFAGLFEYLLQQNNMNAIHVIGSEKSSSFWSWSIAQIEGAYFHFDPYSEYLVTQGEGLKYFGETDDDRINDFMSESFRTPSNVSPPICDDDRYNAVRNCKSWTVENSTIIISE